jgi:hypothetical protein
MNANEADVKKFKQLVSHVSSSLVTANQKRTLRSMPDSFFESVLNKVFLGDIKLARDVLQERYHNINFEEAIQSIDKIPTISQASQEIYKAFKMGVPIYHVSDVDNDGALSTSVSLATKFLIGIDIDVAQRTYNANDEKMGFNVKDVMDWANERGLTPDSSFIVLVTDMGTNQIYEQEALLKEYPNIKLIVIDHHKPIVDNKINANHPSVIWVSPFKAGTTELAVKAGGGVSAGYLTSRVFSHVVSRVNVQDLSPETIELLTKKTPDVDYAENPNKLLELFEHNKKETLKTISLLGRGANFLDRVDCDIRLKPLLKKEVEQINSVSNVFTTGGFFAKWINENQVDNINMMRIPEEDKEVLLDIQDELMKLNFLSFQLVDVAKKIQEFKNDRALKDHLLKGIAGQLDNVEKYNNTNPYFNELKSYFYFYSLEGNLDSSLKKTWGQTVDWLSKEVYNLNKQIVQNERLKQLVDVSLSTNAVGWVDLKETVLFRVLTNKQIKALVGETSRTLELQRVSNFKSTNKFHYTTTMGISVVLDEVKKELGDSVSFVVRGHENKGVVAIVSKLPFDGIRRVINQKVADWKDKQVIGDVLSIDYEQIQFIDELFHDMRLDLAGGALPPVSMRIDEDVYFQDRESTIKRNAKMLVEKDPTGKTLDYIDFGMEKPIIFYHSALKAIVDSNYKAELKFDFASNGLILLSDFYTEQTLKNNPTHRFVSYNEKERTLLSEFYKERFKSKNKECQPPKKPRYDIETHKFSTLPYVVPTTRESAVKGLKFVKNSQKLFEENERLLISLIDEMKADAHITLDVEADGIGNAQCFNVGLTITTINDNSGEIISVSEALERLEKSPDSIKNYAFLDNDRTRVKVNREINTHIMSLLINSKMGENGELIPIKITNNVKSLTNINQRMLDELGISVEEAEEALMKVFDNAGKYILQAHNLPYDNNIFRVNFPRVYENIKHSLHFDSAPLSKDLQISYTNLQVVPIGGYEFFNAEHKGYNLSTLLEEKESFSYPSIKGDAILHVDGEQVSIFDKKTLLSSRLDISREDLAFTAVIDMAPLRYPKYSIAKMLKCASIHDMISNQPVKETVYVDYDDFGTGIKISDELWKRVQDNYAYDKTPNQNLAKLMVIDEVMELIDKESRVDIPNDINSPLAKSKAISFDKSKVKKKDQAKARNELLSNGEVRGRDIILANLINFVNNNSENAERFAISWAYEQVLEKYEATRKDLSQGFIQGLSEQLGIDSSIIQRVYSETFKYKEDRGIKSYAIDETHNNISLTGDMFQEMHVFLYMLRKTVGNHFLSLHDTLKKGLPCEISATPLIKSAIKEATCKQQIRNIVGVSLDSEVANSFSSKQLDAYELSGVVYEKDRKDTVSFKCRSLSDSATNVYIELPMFKLEEFKALSDDEKSAIVNTFERAVTWLVLRNSAANKKLSDEAVGILTKAIESSNLTDTLRNIHENERFSGAYATNVRSLIKEYCQSIVNGITKTGEIKIKINKSIPAEALDEIERTFGSLIEKYENLFNDSPLVDKDVLSTIISRAKDEYIVFEKARNMDFDGAREHLGEMAFMYKDIKPTKSELTKTINILKDVPEDVYDANPTLVSTVLNKKLDPIDYALKSEVVIDVVPDHVVLSQSNDSKLTLGLHDDDDLDIDPDPDSPMRRPR